MGTCVSTVLPRRMLDRSRGNSMKENNITKDGGNVGVPDEVDNTRLAKDGVHTQLPKDDDKTRLPKVEDKTRLPKDDDDDDTRLPKDGDNIHLPDDADNKTQGAATKRRALLVGITYPNSDYWSPLDGPHGDVDRYQELLISA
jgi:hypothetical protein